MKKIILFSALFLTGLVNTALSKPVSVNHFLEIPAVNGTSGYIENPSGYTLAENSYSLGIHKFKFKANYGLLGFIDLGVFFDFAESSDILTVVQRGGLNAKVRLTDEEMMFVTASAGIERLPFSMGDSENWSGCRLYASASKTIGDLSIGFGVSRPLYGAIDISSWELLADAAFLVNDTILTAVEYNGRGFNAGIKISMNYNITIELLALSLEKLGKSAEEGSLLRDHFVFGITYRQ